MAEASKGAVGQCIECLLREWEGPYITNYAVNFILSDLQDELGLPLPRLRNQIQRELGQRSTNTGEDKGTNRIKLGEKQQYVRVLLDRQHLVRYEDRSTGRLDTSHVLTMFAKNDSHQLTASVRTFLAD